MLLKKQLLLFYLHGSAGDLITFFVGQIFAIFGTMTVFVVEFIIRIITGSLSFAGGNFFGCITSSCSLDIIELF